MIGKTIANRYELIHQIGDGGMSKVYKANDHLLDRFVAVKILKQKHLNDVSLVEQFDREAKAAASIQHPNIVNIFDVGIEGSIHYIVMELVSSQTLKDYISSKETYLKNYQIVQIGLQITEALCVAHEHGIVHRDIKPHNILMTDDHKVKVTDFGIAHAITGTATINIGEAIGSVHYASPEQSRGGFVDARSDIYSLGILLYELSTGRVPFDGDTPITVALKHLKESPVVPTALNKMLNPSLQNIILKCLSKAPVDRYQSSNDLLSHLKQISINPNDEIDLNLVMPVSQQTKRLPIIDSDIEITGVEDKKLAPSTVKSENKNTFKAIILGILAAILLLLIYFAIQLQHINNTAFNMPDLKQMTVEQASDSLSQVGLYIEVEGTVVSNYPPETIVSQSPKIGTDVKRGQTVLVKISRGKAMPNIVGKTLANAKVLLADDEVTINVTGEAYSDQAEGVIISQNVVAGAAVDKSKGVDVVVSLGKREKDIVTMPMIMDKTVAEASQILQDNSLIVGDVKEIFNDDVKAGIVYGQMIPAGVRVSADSKISFTVSKGPEVIITSAESTTTSESDNESESLVEATETQEMDNSLVGDQVSKIGNKRKFFIPLGDDKNIYIIKVTKVDGDDETELHNQIHRREEGSVPIEIQDSGEVHLKFYKDDVLIRDDVVNFDKE